MDSRETKKRDAPPLWRPPGSGNSAWPQRSLPPRPAPPPPRRPPPPPAAAGHTRREADWSAAAVAEHGARAQEAGARGERGGDGAERKRPPPAQPPLKRMKKARAGRGDPPEWCKDQATPLGRHRAARAANGGPGAPEKEVAPRPPLAGSKDGGVPLGEALPRAAGTSWPNKAPAAGDARPMAGGNNHGGGTRGVKPSDASRSSIASAADNLPDTGHTLKDRGRSAGTGELHRKENGLPPKAWVGSAELLRHRTNARSSEAVPADGGSGVSKAVLATDAGSRFVANQHPCYGEVQHGELEEGKNVGKVHPMKATTRHYRTSKNRSQPMEKSSSQNFAKNVKGLNKSGGSSSDVAAKSSAQGPSKEHRSVKKVFAIGRVNSGVPPRMSSQSTMTRNKIVRAPEKAANPARRSEKSKVKENETEHGMLVTTNDFVDAEKPTTDRVMGKRPKKKVKNKASNDPPIDIVGALDGKEKLDSKVPFILKDDDVLKAAAVSGGHLKLYTSNSSNFPSLRRQRQHGVDNAYARSKFKMICRRFEFLCRVLVRAVEQNSLSLNGAGGRIDTVADRAMKKMPDFSKPCPVVGKVPGVEVGDQFLYRVQLAVVGLHSRCRGGIDSTKDENGTPIAISIVCSGGYPDEMLCSGELIYTGSGGKLAGNKHDANQKLKQGNLALKNCFTTKSPVRVIYGFGSDYVVGHRHSKAKTYIYDGLYHVVHFCEGGEQGSRMFKYTLKKISGQPELPLHIAKQMMKFKPREGLCMDDISRGKEDSPICVINTIDNEAPAGFTYITRIKSELHSTKVCPQGCGCTSGCSDSDSCSCARKNGGKLPFNLNGAIVSESPFIFECGSSCKCPPSCHNKVSQRGIKIPLEVFRTMETGWGVRSLMSIPSGSFVCEYVGEVRHSMEADQRNNSNYLFNIGHSKGLQQQVSGLNSSDTCSGTMSDVGFTIDATKYGNVGRFINHNCSPNLFAQIVLSNYGDKRVPHVMFFAMETIPPLQELTCKYK